MGRGEGRRESGEAWNQLRRCRGRFRGLSRIEWLDDREDYGEDRFVTVGHVQGREIVVVYTIRGESRRLIMARRATRREREEYHGNLEV